MKNNLLNWNLFKPYFIQTDVWLLASFSVCCTWPFLTQVLCKNLSWLFGEYRAVLDCCRLVALKWMECKDCVKCIGMHCKMFILMGISYQQLLEVCVYVYCYMNQCKFQPGINSWHVYKVSSMQGWGRMLHL